MKEKILAYPMCGAQRKNKILYKIIVSIPIS